MRRILVTFFIVLSFVFSQNALAQDPRTNRWPGMPGENLYSIQNVRVQEGSISVYKRLSLTEKRVTVSRQFEGDFAIDTWSYEAPTETRIASASFKAGDGARILVLLSNGNTVVLTNTSKNIWQEATQVPNPNTLANAQKIIGDAVYVLKSGKVYASRDTAKTWAIDSTNIGKLYTSDISIDTNYYGWIATDQGIFYQHPDSNIWRKAAPLPASFQNAYNIFVDRRNRIFVSRPLQVLVSTNHGSSWSDISGGTTQTITSFGDDAFGNIYAVGWEKAFRLSNLTPPWKSIGDSINGQAYLSSSEKIINSISGDTVLYAATRYGMFQSTDFGANWVHSPDQLQSKAHNFYAGVVKAGKFYFVSSNLGIFRVAAGDTTWEKVYPKQGYIWGVNVLASDSAGNVYANIPFKTGPSTSVFYTFKSIDHGNTWIPDTAGHGALGINAGTQSFDFWVDRQGTEYLGGNGKFYSKKPGQSWKLDTSGLGLKSGQYVKAVTLNNKKGIVYLSRVVFSGSLSLFIYSKASGDSAWKIVNTSILAAGDGILSSDQDGNIIVKAFSSPQKIWRYNGSTWTETPLPTTIGSSPSPYPLTVDRNGVIWAVFFAAGSNKGVYFTSDNGTTWKYVGLNGVGINFLTAVEETTSTLMKTSGLSSASVYAVTIIDGIYGFTTASIPLSVSEDRPQISSSYELYQNYPNPFNPSTTISFTTPERGRAALRIFDILGREVATLVDGELERGSHQATFDASKLSSGIYFYRLQAERFVSVRKMLLLK